MIKTKPFLDCMERGLIHPPKSPIIAEKCIVSTISPGYEGILSDMLFSLQSNGKIPDAEIVIFMLNPDESCLDVAKQFQAHAIICDAKKQININSKSILYSAYEIVDCDKILYIDADILVLEELQSLFAAMDAVDERSIWATKDFYFLCLSKPLYHL